MKAKLRKKDKIIAHEILIENDSLRRTELICLDCIKTRFSLNTIVHENTRRLTESDLNRYEKPVKCYECLRFYDFTKKLWCYKEVRS